MIPETWDTDLYCEYAVFSHMLIAVRVHKDFRLESIVMTDTDSFKWYDISTQPLLVQAIKTWAGSQFRHTMFLQHYLKGLGFEQFDTNLGAH